MERGRDRDMGGRRRGEEQGGKERRREGWKRRRKRGGKGESHNDSLGQQLLLRAGDGGHTRKVGGKEEQAEAG